MQRFSVWLLVIIGLLGLGLGLSLTDKQVEARTGQSFQTDSLLCGEDGGCEAVNTHERARIQVGSLEPIPVALPAFGFFGMVAILALLAALGAPKKREQALAVVALCTIPALLFCAYLVFVQAVIIGSFCPYCLVLDGLTVATALLAVLGHGGGPKGVVNSLRPLPTATLRLAIVAMMLLDGGLYGAYINWVSDAGGAAVERKLSDSGDDGKQNASAENAHSAHDGHGHGATGDALSEAEALEEARKAVREFLKDYPDVEPTSIPANRFDGFKGNPDAEILIVEFADFECPHCRLAGYFMKDIAHRYGDRIGLFFKNYPLGKACNEGLTRDIHPDACEAAVATQCAGRQGRFWPFHDLAFDNQKKLGTKVVVGVASELGLDLDAFRSCLEDETAWDEVRTQVAQGRNAGVRGTPSFFVNGRELPHAHPLFVEAAIRHELRELGATELPEDVDGLFPE